MVAVSSRTATLTGAGGALAVYEAAPAEPTAGLVLIHEAFGLTDHIGEVCRRAAAAGYHVVAPDLFHRGGGGVARYGDLQAAAAYFAGMAGDEGILADIDAALDHLRASGFDDSRIGVLGFCFGGRAAFLAAARRPLGAAVTFYGGGIVKANPFLPFPSLMDDVAAMTTPWLGLYGEIDQGIPMDEVDALEAAVAGCAAETRIIRYPDATHAFHNDQLPTYNEAAAKAGWSEAMRWLADHGVGE